MAEETQTRTVIEAINEFYRLKDKYETGYNTKYVLPIVKSDRPNNAKRVDFSRLPKPECINCKRNVGTIFTIKNDTKEDVRNFIAKCGDLTEPCPLEIQINYSVRDQLYNSIIDGSKSIEAIKLEIIKEKNKALFFNKDVVSAFEKLTSDLKLKTEMVGFGIETNILRNYNPEKYALIKKNILVNIGNYKDIYLAEDYELWLRFIMANKIIKFFPDFAIIYDTEGLVKRRRGLKTIIGETKILQIKNLINPRFKVVNFLIFG